MDFDPKVLDDLLLAAGGRTLDEDRRARLAALHRALVRRPVLFRSHTPGVFEMGDHSAPTILRCGILAAAGAQLALVNPGRADLVRAADFAGPDAANPDISVRSGLKRFAHFLEVNGQRPLASAVLQIQVIEGYLVAPRRRQFDIEG